MPRKYLFVLYPFRNSLESHSYEVFLGTCSMDIRILSWGSQAVVAGCGSMRRAITITAIFKSPDDSAVRYSLILPLPITFSLATGRRVLRILVFKPYPHLTLSRPWDARQARCYSCRACSREAKILADIHSWSPSYSIPDCLRACRRG